MQQQQRSLQELADLAEKFEFAGDVIDGGPHGTGHIHDTYRLECNSSGPHSRVILQRLNHNIFKDIDRLMDNICRVTAHIRSRLETLEGRDPDRGSLTVIPTREGKGYVETQDGEFWRMYLNISNASTYDSVTEPAQAYEAAGAFANFQALLGDLPDPPLHETIPDFHNTPKRYEALIAAAEEDPCGRAESCKPEIDFALGCGDMIGTITSGLADGSIPMRVTHNDTKLNNVMIDNDSGKGVCVVDLDTVMPGSMLYDFGDMVRSMVGAFEENEPDQSVVKVELDRYEQLVSGYLSAGRECLTDRELELMTFSGKLITFEIGIRFLKDYLDGDIYFKINHPHENLDRARTQLALVRSISEHQSRMDAIVSKYA